MKTRIPVGFFRTFNALLLLSCSVTMMHSQTFNYDGSKYTIIDNETKTCSITEYISKKGEYPDSIIIPKKVEYEGEEYTVTEIGDRAFVKSWTPPKITLPNTITRIGIAAFAFCRNLTEINLPESLVEIADSAFYVQGEEYIPHPSALPHKAVGVKNSVPIHIPNGVRRIGKCAFMRDSWYKDANLTPANIPNLLTEIEDFAFYRNIPADPTLPQSLKKIGKYAFFGGYYPNYYSEIPELSIPDNVTTIGEQAFAYSIIQKVRLPRQLTEMCSGVFEGCTKLNSVEIPEGVTVIGACAFRVTSRLYQVPISSITLPTTVKTIGDSAFYGCNQLININLPKGLEKLGKYAFSGASLKSVTMPDHLAEIPDCAFSGCNFTEITIPDGVMSIGECAFSGSLLREIHLPQSLKSIGNYAFRACDLLEISIPNLVDSIGQYAFMNCSKLERVVMSERIKQIQYGLFYGCENLKYMSTTSSLNQSQSINVPEGVTFIGKNAFSGCSSLTSVNIPTSVSKIDGNPFIRCPNLTDIHIDSRNSNYREEGNIIFSITGDTLVYFPYSRGGSYEIPPYVSVIGNSSFEGNPLLERISIPSSVHTIESYAFRDNSSLKNMEMSDGVLHIQNYAFAGCSQLKDPILSKNLVSIENYAFADVTFTNIILPYSLKSIVYGFCMHQDYSLPNDYHLESLRIYGTFDQVYYPVGYCYRIDSIYYLSEDIQGDDYNWNPQNDITWRISESSTGTVLYVLEEAYDKIINDTVYPWKYFPWSQFKDIRIYDPTDDPYFASVREVSGDTDPNLPVSVFSLSGVRVADSTDNLAPGIYIIRQGSQTRKIAVK